MKTYVKVISGELKGHVFEVVEELQSQYVVKDAYGNEATLPHDRCKELASMRSRLSSILIALDVDNEIVDGYLMIKPATLEQRIAVYSSLHSLRIDHEELDRGRGLIKHYKIDHNYLMSL